jgi:hypothetical protein
LLAAGVIGAPTFVVVLLVQMGTREGFDPREHPLSLLSQGDLGWVQVTNFVVTGLLFVAAAVGMRRALHPGRAGTWGPVLVGVFGVSMIWAGVFVTDPALGFPPGTPDGVPDQQSWHSILHAIAPVTANVGLVVAGLVFARRFAGRGEPGWAAYSVASAVVYLGLGFAAFPAGDFRLMLVGGSVIWLWTSVMAARLLMDPPRADAGGRKAVLPSTPAMAA